MKRFIFLGMLSAIFTIAPLASAQDDGPSGVVDRTVAADNSWANRSLTPNKLELQIFAGPTSHQALSIRGGTQEFGLTIAHAHPDHNRVGIPLGLSFGVLDNLEVGIGLPIYLSPGDFGDLPLWATYQFMEGDFQMGAQLALFLPTSSDFGIQVGVPMMYSNGNIRVDTGVFARFNFSSPVATEIYAPARIGFQIMDALYAGAQTELRVHIHDSHTNFNMPIYGFVGYTLDGGLGPIDLGFRFGFDNFIQAGHGVSRAVELRNFSFALGANIGLQF